MIFTLSGPTTFPCRLRSRYGAARRGAFANARPDEGFSGYVTQRGMSALGIFPAVSDGSSVCSRPSTFPIARTALQLVRYSVLVAMSMRN